MARNQIEHQNQKALIDWVKDVGIKKHPELDLIYAIANGGHRHIAVAVKLKAEGVKAGVPDLCLPVARCGYNALYIEMKIKGNGVSKAQEKVIKSLEDEGNKVVVCFDWVEAKENLERYLLNG